MWKYSAYTQVLCGILLPGTVHSIQDRYYEIMTSHVRFGEYDSCTIVQWELNVGADICSKYPSPCIVVRCTDGRNQMFTVSWWVDCRKCRYWKEPYGTRTGSNME